MKAVIIAAALFVLGLGGYAWYVNHQKAAQVARERDEAQRLEDAKRKAAENRKKAANDARLERDEEVRLNGPERNRLQRRYSEEWKELELRAGGDLSDCVVTASGEMRDLETKERIEPPTLRARCGATLDKRF